MLDHLRRLGRQFLGESAGRPAPRPALGAPGDVVRPRVLQIVHNPIVESEGGRRLAELFGWNDPDELVRQYIADLATCSADYLQYQIVERIDADWYPVKKDGF